MPPAVHSGPLRHSLPAFSGTCICSQGMHTQPWQSVGPSYAFPTSLHPRSKEPIPLNTWVSVFLERNERKGVMRINHGERVMGESPVSWCVTERPAPGPEGHGTCLLSNTDWPWLFVSGCTDSGREQGTGNQGRPGISSTYASMTLSHRSLWA